MFLFFILGDVFWAVCAVPPLSLQYLDVGFSRNCLVGGNEEVDMTRKQTG